MGLRGGMAELQERLRQVEGDRAAVEVEVAALKEQVGPGGWLAGWRAGWRAGWLAGWLEPAG